MPNLEKAIAEECKKHISRHFTKVAHHRRLKGRYERATGNTGGTSQTTPSQWSIAAHFNPFIVRKRASRISHSIETALEAGHYDPLPSLVLRIQKGTSSYRQVSISPVADAAVAKLFWSKIRRRNQSRFSPFSYGYRLGVGPHESLERIWRIWKSRTRFYTVEFDFSKFFDTISHEYIESALLRNFKVTRTEMRVIRSTLKCRRAFGPQLYHSGAFQRRQRGIPQGNTLSLFLANVACHELDTGLTRVGLPFARYADDIIVFCDTEKQGGEAVSVITEHCSKSSISVNFTKSNGVKLCTPEGFARHPPPGSKTYFEYLGHRFHYTLVNRKNHPAPQLERRISIRPSTVHRIRTKVSNIMYAHLLRYAERGEMKSTRVDLEVPVDWDLVTCINDLRRYIYGGLSEEHVQGALRSRKVRLHRMFGAVGYFPLVNNVEQMKELDGWFSHALASSLKRREETLRNNFGLTAYTTLSAKDLIEGKWYNAAKVGGIPNDVRLPSFVRAWKYVRKGLHAFDLKDFPSRGTSLGDENLYD